MKVNHSDVPVTPRARKSIEGTPQSEKRKIKKISIESEVCCPQCQFKFRIDQVRPTTE
jgi:hypothetical protein